MNVQKLMTRKVTSCHPQDTMDQAARIFEENDCGCIPVTDEDAHVVGMITDRDVCLAAYRQQKKLAQMPVSSAMTKDVHCCQPTDTVAHAEEIMRTYQVRRIPVVDAKKHLVGVLSLNDIAREAARERKASKTEITDAEVAQTLSTVGTPRKRSPAMSEA